MRASFRTYRAGGGKARAFVEGAPVPAPQFVILPDASPRSGAIGTTFTASDGAVINGAITGRRWLLSGTAIGTGATVTPAAAGQLVRENTATGPGGTVTVTSDPISITVPAPVNTALPTISGTAQEGQTLTASTGTWTNNPTAFAFQWKRNGVAISGSVNPTRVLTAGDLSAVMTCEVTASNSGGAASATSAGTSAVIAASTPIPVNTVAPAITGNTSAGSTLTATTGTWSNAPTSYAYQWRRDGVNITGATANTYVLTAADEGRNILCRVEATNAGGTAPAFSNTVAIPTVTVTPTLVDFTVEMAAPKFYADAIGGSFYDSTNSAPATALDQAVGALRDLSGNNRHAPAAATANGAGAAANMGALGEQETVDGVTFRPLITGFKRSDRSTTNMGSHRYNLPTGAFESASGNAGDIFIWLGEVQGDLLPAVARALMGSLASGNFGVMLGVSSTTAGAVYAHSSTTPTKVDVTKRDELLVQEKVGTASNVQGVRVNDAEATPSANGTATSIGATTVVSLLNSYGSAQAAPVKTYAMAVLPKGTPRETVQRVTAAMAWKYGKQALLPATSPYRYARPKVLQGDTSVAAYMDINTARSEQTFEGFEVELQNLVGEYPYDDWQSQAKPQYVRDRVGGFLAEITPAERTRFATDVLGYGNGVRALRWSGGLWQARGFSADGKELLPMYTTSAKLEPGSTQLTHSVDEFELLKSVVTASGKPIEIYYEEWSCAPYWVGGIANWGILTPLVYPDPSTATAAYATWLEDFTTAYFNNMKRVDAAGFKITRVRGFNEIGNTQQGRFPHIQFSTTNDAKVLGDFHGKLRDKLRAAQVGVFANSNPVTMKFTYGNFKGWENFGAAQAKTALGPDLTEWAQHYIGMFGADAEYCTQIATTSAAADGRPTVINEHEFFDGSKNALLKPVGQTTSVTGVPDPVPGKGADAYNYMATNFPLLFVRNVTLNQAPTHMLMIHAAKPSYDNDDGLGYAWVVWRSTLATDQDADVRVQDPAFPNDPTKTLPLDPSTNRTGDAAFDGMTKGTWRTYDQHWNIISGCLRHIPWDSVRLSMTNWRPGTGQGAIAFRTPAGKLVYMVVNRTAAALPLKVGVGSKADGAPRTMRGYRYSNTVRDGDLGTVVSPIVPTTVQPWTVEFWVEQ